MLHCSVPRHTTKPQQEHETWSFLAGEGTLDLEDSRAYDAVDRPEHYNTGAIEAIDAIEASMTPEEFKGYLKGNALKYLWRYRYKGKPLEDLRKAQWYLERLVRANEQ